jgi:cyclopropane-fatty-acyl-phospholipid synthase
MNVLLKTALNWLIVEGSLEVVDSSGASQTFGNGNGKTVRIRFTSPAAERSVVFDPEMKLGEAYVNGGYVIESGSVLDFTSLLMANVGSSGRTWWTRALASVRRGLRRFNENNNPMRARHNVHHHYDLDGRLYRLFLDEDLQYSCAYFAPGVETLDEAQREKKRHLGAKLDLKPGQRVLDIGSGWGGLGIYLAEHYDVDVTGVTLSDEQFAVSNQRAKDRGVSDRVRFLLKDYRHIDGPFDRIVSVGMFEHVGRSHYPEFFRHVDRLLSPDGIAVVHTIAKKAGRGPINPWMERYIFPGAYLPTLSELAPVMERQELWLTDLEVLRLHYAETLAAWNRRFQARRAEAAAIYDERFCRMWEYYLQVCEAGFRLQGLCVFQLQLSKDIEAVPLTRDYIYGGGYTAAVKAQRMDGRRRLRQSGARAQFPSAVPTEVQPGIAEPNKEDDAGVAATS